MSVSTIAVLILIGLAAGVLSGFVGVGGGIVIVPALIYFLGLTQHQAQGTSLMLMLPPIGVLAVYNYYQSGQLDKQLIFYAIIIALTFVIGGYLGSKLSLKLSPLLVKFVFGIILLYVSIKMIISGSKHFLE
jgi:uncharacterized membrane protein YfcA